MERMLLSVCAYLDMIWQTRMAGSGDRSVSTMSWHRDRLVERRFGFTLGEILIGVAVMGVLVAIALPSISKARTQSRREEANVQLELLSNAILKLAWDTGEWPGGIPRNSSALTSYPETWDLNAASSGLRSAGTLFSKWKGPYFTRVPLDPWGKPYFFDNDYTTGGRVRIVVGSFGPNRVGQNLYDSDDIFVILD